MIYAVFLCLNYAGAPQLNNCQPLRINGETQYYQSKADCKKIADTMNAHAAVKGWVCMAKPGWQPAQ
jgi:hypothetical protein